MDEKHSILANLKRTVDTLVSTPSFNLSNTCGAVSRLTNNVDAILNHRFILSQSSSSYWNFIKCLKWLEPLSTPLIEQINRQPNEFVKGKQWISEGLRNYKLTSYLKLLIDDKEHLGKFYNEDAFLRNPSYSQAFLLCLQAVEMEKPEILVEIDPRLLHQPRLSHLRSASLPPLLPARDYSHFHSGHSSPPQVSRTGSDALSEVQINEENESSTGADEQGTTEGEGEEYYTPTASSPALQRSPSAPAEAESASAPVSEPTPVPASVLPSPRKIVHKKSRSDLGLPAAQELALSSSSMSVPEEPVQQMMPRRDSMTSRTGDTQALFHFFNAQDLAVGNDLDRENAHFSLSEALIAAVEQMKFNNVLRFQSKDDDDPEDECFRADPEIKRLQQRIRIRKKELLRQGSKSWTNASSDGRTDDTTTTSDDFSPRSSAHEDSFFFEPHAGDLQEEDGEAFVDYAGDDSEQNLAALQGSGLSLSLASLYTEDDLGRPETATRATQDALKHTTSTAGSIAISLLKRFPQSELPSAEELEWIITDCSDVPQALLPLPKSPATGSLQHSTRLRGSLEWAPPRQQIILTLHPASRRADVVARQNFRCAGCGMKIDKAHIRRLRYCEYLGKYFCQYCHENDLHRIPARIIHKWDFNEYSVSKFAKELLTRINDEPIFNLRQLRPELLKKSTSLNAMNQIRNQLWLMKDYVNTCRFAVKEMEKFNQAKHHLWSDPDLYSMSDIFETKFGQMRLHLEVLRDIARKHIYNCDLCKAKGFICEYCRQMDDILYPFELQRTVSCPICHAVFHKSCFMPEKCPKCMRLEARKLARELSTNAFDQR